MRNPLSNLLRITCLVGAAALALSAPAALETVGNLGDPQRLVFEGNAAFPNPLLCGALRSSLDYVLAAQPNSPLPDLVDALPKLLVAGYRSAGFGEAQVAARHDTNRGRLVITIQEGPRYRCGAIRVTGAKALPVTLLIDRLRPELSPTNMPSAKPGPDLLAEAARLDKDTPSALEQLGLLPAGGITLITNSSQVAVPAGTWHTNGFAAFDSGANLRYAEAVTNTFRALGWYGARFTTALAPDPASHTADLVVAIEDEGKPVTLGAIQIAGLKRNNREELLRYVGLEPGMRLTEDIERRVLKKLWDSGRFTQGRSEMGPPDARGRATLQISVVELDLAPPLKEEFSDNQKAALRLRDWLQNFRSQESDLGWELNFTVAATRQRFSANFLASPSGVLLGQLEELGASPDSRRSLYAGFAGAGTWGLFAPRHQIKAVESAPEGTLSLKCGLSAKGQATNQGHLFLGWGFSSARGNSGGPFSMDLDLEPAAFVEFARMVSLTAAERADPRLSAWALERTSLQREGREVRVTFDGGTLRFEEATGRLLDLKGTLPMDSPWLAGPVEYRVFTQRGALADATRRLSAATARHRDVSRSNAVTTAIAFLGETLLRSPELHRLLPQQYAPGKLAAASAALNKYAAALKLPEVWNAHDAAPGSPETLAFQIPPSALDPPSPTLNPLSSVAAWFAAPGQNLVPAGSWLERLFLSLTLQLSGRSERAEAELQAVYADERTGPIACWIIAQSLDRLGNPAARAFAMQGLLRRTADDFRNDYRVLLRGESTVAQVVASLLTSLGVLDPEDVEALAAVLPAADATLLRQTRSALKQGGGKPWDEVLGPALDQWWKAAMKDRMGVLLRRILAPTASRTAQAQVPAH